MLSNPGEDLPPRGGEVMLSRNNGSLKGTVVAKRSHSGLTGEMGGSVLGAQTDRRTDRQADRQVWVPW